MAIKPPPRLTKQQFLRKKPVNPVAGRTGQQRYQAYLNAYKTQNAAKGPRPLSYGSLLANLQGSFETPAQLEARANRMAKQQFSLSQTEIRDEAARMRKEAQLRAESMAAAGRAAAAQNAGLFGMVGGEYNAAAQEIRGLGTNLANQVADTTAGQVLAQNAGLSNIGAPDVAVGGPAGANTVAGPGQAHVAAYQQGELPGQAIGTAGEAATFGLAGMVSAQNLRATQEAAAAFQQSVREADSARVSALKELRAGRTANAAQFLLQLQDAQRQQISLAMTLLNARADVGQGQQQINIAKQGAKTEKAENTRNYKESVRQFNQKMAEDKRQFNKSLQASKSKAAKGAKGGDARELIASVVANLGANAFDPEFQNGLASIYYGSPTPASGQPSGKDAKQRENAVVNYLMNVYWPQVDAVTPKANRVVRSQELLAKILAWFRRAPLPDYDTYRLNALKGG